MQPPRRNGAASSMRYHIMEEQTTYNTGQTLTLGIYPNMKRTGYAVIAKKNEKLSLVKSGLWENTTSDKTDLFGYIYEEVQALIQEYEIKAIYLHQLTACETISVIHAVAHQNFIKAHEINVHSATAALTGKTTAKQSEKVNEIRRIFSDDIAHKPAFHQGEISAIATALSGIMIEGARVIK